MTPEERDAFVAKLKEERRERYNARKRECYKANKAKYPNTYRDHARSYRIENAGKLKRQNANGNIKRMHGITLEEKEAMLTSQNNCCAICGTATPTKKGWHVDHCHSSKEIRGILCHICNCMLGYARDDVSILLRGIYYLDRHNLTSGGNNHGNKSQD